jgi:selenocysteine lyase/cysteine desulfurase
MTKAYHYAHEVIKEHVNAGPDDVIITANSGMTGVVCKFQRILGLKIPEKFSDKVRIPVEERPVVFITHLEHHSNHTSWLETIADVVVLEPDGELMVVPENLKAQLLKFRDRKIKIGAFSGCSNVTGYIPPYRQLARIMHEEGGLCFIDFAASAPYVDMNMHSGISGEDLDAIYFSPHKFLGGPGGSGILVFNGKLYKNRIPDHPGGGTLNWTNRWNEYRYVSDVETREDGGTPGFLQAFKAALCIRLKEKMGVGKIIQRDNELLEIAYNGLSTIPGLHLLAGNIKERLGVISFYVEGIHHNLMAKLLNDVFGIQVRGGCSCAGTYGHYLLGVDWETSHDITRNIDHGDLSMKPGWIRISLHPTMTDAELNFIIHSIADISKNSSKYINDYHYDRLTNEFMHKSNPDNNNFKVHEWFDARVL